MLPSTSCRLFCGVLYCILFSLSTPSHWGRRERENYNFSVKSALKLFGRGSCIKCRRRNEFWLQLNRSFINKWSAILLLLKYETVFRDGRNNLIIYVRLDRNLLIFSPFVAFCFGSNAILAMMLRERMSIAAENSNRIKT